MKIVLLYVLFFSGSVTVWSFRGLRCNRLAFQPLVRGPRSSVSSPLAVSSTKLSSLQSVSDFSSLISNVPAETKDGLKGIAIWGLMLFSTSALHAAETAITKLSPWKLKPSFIKGVHDRRDPESSGSPLDLLGHTLPSVLNTVLIVSTALSIFSTALFMKSLSQVFPSISLTWATFLLTVITLIFGELFPKALAIANSEVVAIHMVPWLNLFCGIFAPVTSVLSSFNRWMLKAMGLKAQEDSDVSEDMLRLVLWRAQQSKEGINRSEGKMIENLLNMQETEISRIMQPRVNIVAMSEKCTIDDLLEVFSGTKYSRIPIYRKNIDNIVGIVFSKDILAYLKSPHRISNTSQTQVDWRSKRAQDFMKPMNFLPETKTVYDSLNELQRKRIHMAIIVDEFGGTAGLVTMEDILENIVGEIYDEDEAQEQIDDSKEVLDMGSYYLIKGRADLSTVFEQLNLLIEDDDILDEYSTIGGYICYLSGCIPDKGKIIKILPYKFEVLDVEDGRRISNLKVTQMTEEELELERLNNSETETEDEDDRIIISSTQDKSVTLEQASTKLEVSKCDKEQQQPQQPESSIDALL